MKFTSNSRQILEWTAIIHDYGHNYDSWHYFNLSVDNIIIHPAHRPYANNTTITVEVTDFLTDSRPYKFTVDFFAQNSSSFLSGSCDIWVYVNDTPNNTTTSVTTTTSSSSERSSSISSQPSDTS
ncbi:MAG: hypothetical protein ACXAEU_07215 [Candidatus Hodarchaeales archaeon]